MKRNNKALLQNPQGTDSFCLEEAAFHRKIAGRFSEILTLWGYLPVQTPIFDFYDIYSDYVKSEDVYRLTDREGDLLLLRNDVTLFLAKQISSLLEPKNLPLRVFYSDTILRHENKTDISKNEFFQTGAELFGVGGEKGDLEILFLLEEMLASLPIQTFLHLGSRKLFNLACAGLPPEITPSLATVVRNRDFELLTSILAPVCSESQIDRFHRLFSFIGPPKAFASFAESLDSQPLREEALYIAALGEKTARLFPNAEIRTDTSEIGERNYYTGMVFRVYTEHAATEIAGGGRYDTLMEHFGTTCASVGFSLMQRKIESLPTLRSKTSPQPFVTLTGDDTAELYLKAKSLREQGGIVKLC